MPAPLTEDVSLCRLLREKETRGEARMCGGHNLSRNGPGRKMRRQVKRQGVAGEKEKVRGFIVLGCQNDTRARRGGGRIRWGDGLLEGLTKTEGGNIADGWARRIQSWTGLIAINILQGPQKKRGN